ncbi:MAG: hypothetical protein RR051_07960, partial [Clostridiales bacterium]
MKKIITKALPMLLILCLTVVMVGCGNKAANPATPNNDKPAASKPGDQPVTAEKTLWTQIKEKGVITVGNSPDYEPYEFEDGKGNVIGFDI